MTLARLQEILAGFGRLHITVVGDLFLDRWWEVDRSLDEPSVETGLTAYQVTGRRQSRGGAARRYFYPHLYKADVFLPEKQGGNRAQPL